MGLKRFKGADGNYAWKEEEPQLPKAKEEVKVEASSGKRKTSARSRRKRA